MKLHCIESTLDYDYGDYNVRLWLSESTLLDDASKWKVYQEDYGEVIAQAIDKSKNYKSIITRLAKIEGINAIQIRDITRSRGIMVYLVPF